MTQIHNFKVFVDFINLDTSGEIHVLPNKTNFSAQKAEVEWTVEIAPLKDYGLEYIVSVSSALIWYDYDNDEGDVETDGLLLWTPKETKVIHSDESNLIVIRSVDIDFETGLIEVTL